MRTLAKRALRCRRRSGIWRCRRRRRDRPTDSGQKNEPVALTTPIMATSDSRFITGGAPKNSYVINTPSGTVGVRGTAFDLFVTTYTTPTDNPDAKPDGSPL